MAVFLDDHVELLNVTYDRTARPVKWIPKYVFVCVNELVLPLQYKFILRKEMHYFLWIIFLPCPQLCAIPDHKISNYLNDLDTAVKRFFIVRDSNVKQIFTVEEIF